MLILRHSYCISYLTIKLYNDYINHLFSIPSTNLIGVPPSFLKFKCSMTSKSLETTVLDYLILCENYSFFKNTFKSILLSENGWNRGHDPNCQINVPMKSVLTSRNEFKWAPCEETTSYRDTLYHLEFMSTLTLNFQVAPTAVSTKNLREMKWKTRLFNFTAFRRLRAYGKGTKIWM